MVTPNPPIVEGAVATLSHLRAVLAPMTPATIMPALSIAVLAVALVWGFLRTWPRRHDMPADLRRHVYVLLGLCAFALCLNAVLLLNSLR